MEVFAKRPGEVRKQIRVAGRKVNFFWHEADKTYRLPTGEPVQAASLDEARDRVASQAGQSASADPQDLPGASGTPG
jgi:hypothetical protein